MISIPTEVLFVDDNSDFLSGLEGLLNGSRHNFHFLKDVSQALQLVESKKNKLQFLQQLDQMQELESYHEISASFDYRYLYQEIFQKNRFDTLSIVVADYSMPVMNGLEFLNQLPNRNIKRILLTGEADEKIAVRAFNNGLIHNYIKKSDAKYGQKLNESIKQLTQEYWNDATKPLKQVLKNHFPVMPLDDPKFQEYFAELIETRDIVEYYLLDGSFRFLMVDAQGILYTLWVQTKAEAQSYAFEFERYDEIDIPANVRRDVKECRKILCPPIKNGIWPHRSEWVKHFRDAKRVGEHFFAAIAQGYDIEKEIMPFNIKKQHHAASRVA